MDCVQDISCVYVKKSPIHGYGAFARRDIACGEIVECCYCLTSQKPDLSLQNYYFEFDDKKYIALGYGSIYNHSQNPNLNYKYNFEYSLLTFTANRAIKKDEELLIWYGKNWFASRRIQEVQKSWRYILKSFLSKINFGIRLLFVLTILIVVTHFKE